jgi:hypothetical protein
MTSDIHEQLSDLLHDEARLFSAPPDLLDAATQRVGPARVARRRRRLAVVGALAVAAALVVAATTVPNWHQRAVPATTESPTTVYLIQHDANYPRLASVVVSAPNTGDAGLDAARALMSVPSSRGRLLNGFQYEPALLPTDIESVITFKRYIAVTVSDSAHFPAGREGPDKPVLGYAAYQQLVWTVQQALHSQLPVALIKGGTPIRYLHGYVSYGSEQADPSMQVTEGSAIPGVLDCLSIVHTPAELTITCGDGLLRLTRLRWNSPRSNFVVAHGVLRTVVDPVAGPSVRVPVTATFFRPVGPGTFAISGTGYPTFTRVRLQTAHAVVGWPDRDVVRRLGFS